jgi:hypothetical protein
MEDEAMLAREIAEEINAVLGRLLADKDTLTGSGEHSQLARDLVAKVEINALSSAEDAPEQVRSPASIASLPARLGQGRQAQRQASHCRSPSLLSLADLPCQALGPGKGVPARRGTVQCRVAPPGPRVSHPLCLALLSLCRTVSSLLSFSCAKDSL